MPATPGGTRAALPFLLAVVAQAQTLTAYNNTAMTGFPPCDALLSSNLSHAVYLPSSPEYPTLVNGSWAANTRSEPWCFVRPSTPSEISQTIAAIQAAGNGAGNWGAAIRSGGHGSDLSNNIVNGVTIDLGHLNTTTYDAKSNVAMIDAGSRWLDVYVALEKEGVSVTGGREGIVGVGGFTLGGGNSFYTARTGFSCDSVVNYEVVLANGEIINANATSHSDLWRALKGGGSNFGIITRFDVEAFPATNLTMETRIIAGNESTAVSHAIEDFTNLDQSHQDNAMLTLMMYRPESQAITISVIEVNTANDFDTTAFDKFNAIPTLTPSERQSMSLVNFANRSEVPEGTLNTGLYLTFANDARIVRFCVKEHDAIVKYMNSTFGPKAFSTIMDWQPLPAYYSDISMKKGGNMLGLERDPRNKLFFTLGVTMLSPEAQAQYSQVYQRVGSGTQKINAYAKSIGGSEQWVYMNYAHANQDVFSSYGEANVDHIKKTAKKYDPDGFFQRMVPGGFKISRVE